MLMFLSEPKNLEDLKYLVWDLGTEVEKWGAGDSMGFYYATQLSLAIRLGADTKELVTDSLGMDIVESLEESEKEIAVYLAEELLSNQNLEDIFALLVWAEECLLVRNTFSLARKDGENLGDILSTMLKMYPEVIESLKEWAIVYKVNNNVTSCTLWDALTD
jgi:hypothetical protein